MAGRLAGSGIGSVSAPLPLLRGEQRRQTGERDKKTDSVGIPAVIHDAPFCGGASLGAAQECSWILSTSERGYWTAVGHGRSRDS